MEHPILKATGDIAAWTIVAAVAMGVLTKVAVILGIAWHICQLYGFFEKRNRKDNGVRTRKTDKE